VSSAFVESSDVDVCVGNAVTVLFSDSEIVGFDDTGVSDGSHDSEVDEDGVAVGCCFENPSSV